MFIEEAIWLIWCEWCKKLVPVIDGVSIHEDDVEHGEYYPEIGHC